MTDRENRENVAGSLEEQLAFEHLVSELSSWFIQLPGDGVDARFQQALSRIGEFLDVDVVAFGQFSMDGSQMRRRFGWFREPAIAQRAAAAIPARPFPNLVPYLLRHGHLVFGNHDEHPDWPVEFEYLRHVGYHAGVVVTVGIDDQHMYWMAISCLTARVWPADIARRVRILGEIFAYADSRREAEQKLRAEQDLLRLLLEVQERERKAVVARVHDGPVQDGMAANLRLEALRHELEKVNPDLLPNFQAIKDLLKHAAVEGRRLIAELRSPVIDRDGLVLAVQDLADDARVHAGLTVVYAPEVQFAELEPNFEVAVYRIIQEALDNVKRHAQTACAIVRLEQTGDQLRVEIWDEGIGFDLATLPEGCFGLCGIRTRARLFGGHADIVSSPGQGTKITVEIPIRLK